MSNNLDRFLEDFEYCQYLGVRPLTIKRAYQQAVELADELELPSQLLAGEAERLKASDDPEDAARGDWLETQCLQAAVENEVPYAPPKPCYETLRASDLSLLVTEVKALRGELDGTIPIVEDDSGLSWQEKLLRIKQELAEGDTAKELREELQEVVKDRGATLEFAEALDLSDVWKDIFKRKELENRAKEATDALALDTEPALDASLSR